MTGLDGTGIEFTLNKEQNALMLSKALYFSFTRKYKFNNDCKNPLISFLETVHRAWSSVIENL